jgi:hypothetical protein
LIDKFPKRLEDLSSMISEVQADTGVLASKLAAGRKDFDLGKWKPVPDVSPIWGKIEDLIEKTQKQIDKIAKLSK